MKKIIVLLILLILSISVVAVKEFPVHCQWNTPGATISVEGQSGMADENGSCEPIGMFEMRKTYDYEVSKEGFHTKTGTITITDLYANTISGTLIPECQYGGWLGYRYNVYGSDSDAPMDEDKDGINVNCDCDDSDSSNKVNKQEEECPVEKVIAEIKPLPIREIDSSPATHKGDCNKRYRNCMDWANDKQLVCLDNIESRYKACQENDEEHCSKIRYERKKLCDNPETEDQKICKEEVKICNAPFQEKEEENNIVETSLENDFDIDQWDWQNIDFDNEVEGILLCSTMRTQCFNAASTSSDKNECNSRQDDCVERVQRLSNSDPGAEDNEDDNNLETNENQDDDEYDPDALFHNEIRISGIKGEFEIARSDNAPFFVPEEGDIIKEGYVLFTGIDSEVILNFPDGSEVIVRDLTMLQIDKFYFGDERQETILNLRTGSVKPHIKPRSGIRSGFSVINPTSIASVRGTEFEMSYNNKTNTSLLKTFEGIVRVQDMNGQSLDISKGEQIEIKDSLGDVNHFDLEQEKSSLKTIVQFVLFLIVLGTGYWYLKKEKMF